MTTFEYLAVLVSIVVGLAVTHVLQVIGRVISRPGRQILFWVHSLWVLYALSQIVFFWWFELAYRAVQEWSPALYVFVLGYSVALYLECVVLVPEEPEPDYRAYYFSRQKWILGVVMAIWLIDWCDTLMKPAFRERMHQHPVAGIAPWIITEALLLPALFTKKVWYHGLVATLMLLSVLTAFLTRPALGH
jgi:hypothetical protein